MLSAELAAVLFLWRSSFVAKVYVRFAGIVAARNSIESNLMLC